MVTVAEYLRDFQLRSQLDSFVSGDVETVVDTVLIGDSEVPRYTNEFWTAEQRQSHSLHEISYRACFKAELPRFFIHLFTKRGDTVYDPFMGRGTTLLEAALMGRNVAGNDVNPLSRTLVEPRLNPPSLNDVARRLESIPWSAPEDAGTDLSMFYSPKTLSAILALRTYLAERRTAGVEDGVDRWIRMVATNRLTGHSPGFFSVYTLPPNQAVTPDAQRKINEQRGQEPPDRDVAAIILKKTRSLISGISADDRANLRSAGEQARYFSRPAGERIDLEDDSVDLVVTSPPFLDIVQYVKDNWLRCWFNGIDAESVASAITTPRTVDEWGMEMRSALTQLHRVVRPGGWVAFEVGEVRKGSVNLDEVIAPIGVDAGFERHGIVVNKQDFTKTANCWGVDNNCGGTNTNRIVLFGKP